MADQDLHRQAWELNRRGLNWADAGEVMGSPTRSSQMASQHSCAADADAASVQFALF